MVPQRGWCLVGGQRGCGDRGGLGGPSPGLLLWVSVNQLGAPREASVRWPLHPGPPAIWTEPELALRGLRCPQPGLDSSWGALGRFLAVGVVYAFYRSSQRCPRSLRTEIRTHTLQVNIRCAGFYCSSVGGSINLLAVAFLRKPIPSSSHYSQLLFWGQSNRNLRGSLKRQEMSATLPEERHSSVPCFAR